MTVSSTKISDICLIAGKIMLVNGGETYRVEDTMSRIAKAFGYANAHSFVTPTGIIFSLEDSEATKFVRISERTVNLEKVTLVNSISRQIAEGTLSVEEAIQHLDEIDNTPHSYSISLRIIASGLVSACFLIMFLGQWKDFVPAFIAGSIGFTCFIYFHKVIKIQFFAEFLASFVIGTLAYWMVHLGVGAQMDKIIIGSVMPLVPGLLITNAVRDLMAGHLVSGLSKGAEAFLTAFAIGSGVAVVFTIY
ncbi:threonine/serine exporter family protein [Bacillaceae bacterium S4-13-56]